MEPREIKFRVWLEGKMLSHDWLISANAVYKAIHEPSDKNAVVMQFTGLKDKNGKEIYEGDIISAWSDGYNHKGEIRWILSGTPRIIIYPAFANQGFWGLHGSEKKEGDMFIDVNLKLEIIKAGKAEIIDDGVEVIGNIFENPELKP